ncbi:hypothetical protein GXP67_33755 [Rhodocytophaga rosea]|uniref:Uncharacterized protein n=1 Tax=Rhodocytophaga rosea TaxID=2704465 RepID=A0A6C0GSY8_9BACT|nr:hypothetical protein [Rhodocytophaga rosea]QHT71268.1 hypothetical protein GXP67_33755 [Rhodocytophaga rosea]
MMKKNFYLYYYLWFAIFSIIFGFFFLVEVIFACITLQGVEIVSQIFRTLIFCIGEILVLTLLIGGYHHLDNTLFWSWKMLAILKRKELRELETIHFKLDEKSRCYAGFYKNYYCLITSNSIEAEGSSLIISAFITPVEENIQDLEQLADVYGLTITDAAIWVEKAIVYDAKKIPGLNQITQEMDKLIEYLISKNISPAQVDIIDD